MRCIFYSKLLCNHLNRLPSELINTSTASFGGTVLCLRLTATRRPRRTRFGSTHRLNKPHASPTMLSMLLRFSFSPNNGAGRVRRCFHTSQFTIHTSHFTLHTSHRVSPSSREVSMSDLGPLLFALTLSPLFNRPASRTVV
jgi:hypothetical protein